MTFIKTLIRLWFRRRFTKALDRADWRTAVLPSDAAHEVARLRKRTIINPVNK